MEFSEFKIDEVFYTESGEWKCVDKGATYVIAVKSKYYPSLNRFAPGIALMVFEPFDFKNCHKTPVK